MQAGAWGSLRRYVLPHKGDVLFMVRVSARAKSFLGMVIFSLVFIFGATMGVTFAYFSDTVTTTSTLNFGKLKIDLSNNVAGEVQKTIAVNAVQGVNGYYDGTKYWMSSSDIVTLAGSVGLEQNSIDAYIRMKITLLDEDDKTVMARAFRLGFLNQMQTIVQNVSGTKIKWFVVGNYLYLGNKITDSTPFTYSASNENEDTSKTTKNAVEVTDNMLVECLHGQTIKIKFTYQAVQTAGLDLGSLSGYSQENATAISNLSIWQDVFGVDLNDMYEIYGEGYVSGTLDNAVTHNGTEYATYGDYTSVLGKEVGVLSPYAFFNKDEAIVMQKNRYVAFGFYPQTIKATSAVLVNSAEPTYTFNGNNYYMDKDGYLYERANSVYNKTFSNGTGATGSTFFFKLEPLIWRIAGTENVKGKESLLLNSVIIIKNSSYFVGGQNRIINGQEILPCNYEYSLIRSYLNGYVAYGANTSSGVASINNNYLNNGFVQQAFTSNQYKQIKVATVNNGKSTTRGNCQFAPDDGSENSTTEDRVFVLSYQDLDSNDRYASEQTKKYPTDYGYAKGVERTRTGNDNGSDYWTRSPNSMDMGNGQQFGIVSYISFGGWMMFGSQPENNYMGIVPALFIAV